MHDAYTAAALHSTHSIHIQKPLNAPIAKIELWDAAQPGAQIYY